MADWAKFANLLGMAQYGDDVRAVKERKRKEGIEAEELGFKRDANTRATAAEGRQANEFEFSQTQRPMLMKKLQQQIDAGELDLKDAQNKLAEFDAAGGATGAAQRTKETHGIRMNEDKRAGVQTGLAVNRDKREQEAQGERIRGARLGNDYEEATLPARIDEKNDPLVKDSQLFQSIVQALNSAIRMGDKEQIDSLRQDYEVLRNEMLKKKALATARRESVRGTGGPVKTGSPYDVFK